MDSAKKLNAPVLGIVTIGYNRADSMMRLLNRLNDCDYPCGDVPLVISLDNCGKDDVFALAERFDWKHGEKRVIHQPERLGLRKHILKCGTYMTEFGWDAQIVLEDDVYPASAFYHFAMQAVERYEADDRIAGISLYNMPQNQTAVLPFSPIASPYDTFFMQLAQSWGQVWMKRQWQAFVDWYAAHSEPFKSCPGVPDNVCRWPESSWLKYHIRYCIEQDKLFVYPYQSLTTCFSDAGSHTARKSNVLQVALQQRAKTRYAFPEPEEAVIYDAWSENTGLAEVLKLPAEELCADLYGKKRNRQKRRYILTMESLPYQVLQSFALELTPMEANVICNLRGKDIFLYDTAKPAQRPAVQDPDLRFWSFYNRIIYPDPIIRKLAKPIEREIWKNRLKTLSKPKWLLRKLKHRLKH